MINIIDYFYIDKQEKERVIKVHYKYIPGHKACLLKAPEDCYPVEPPEVSVLCLKDSYDRVLSDNIMEEILKDHEENIINQIMNDLGGYL